MITDKEAFLFKVSIDKVLENEKYQKGVGTLKEKTIHKVIKNYYESDIRWHEIKVAGHICDCLVDNVIYEIQTANFNLLRNKLDDYLVDYQVKIVYPLSYTKYLGWINEETSEVSKLRKSPLGFNPFAIFKELYKIKQYLTKSNLSIVLMGIDLVEYRLLNGYSTDKKKGSSRFERIPKELKDIIYLDKPKDYLYFLSGMNDAFSVKELAKEKRITIRLAQLTMNVLNHINVVKRVSKIGNAFYYQVCE